MKLQKTKDGIRTVTFGELTLNLTGARLVNNLILMNVMVLDKDMIPVDIFEMYKIGNIWYAWLADSFSEVKRRQRDHIAFAYNQMQEGVVAE